MTLSLEIVDQNNFASGFYHFKVKIQFFGFLSFLTPKRGLRGLFLMSCKAHIPFPNNCPLKLLFRYLEWFTHKSTEYSEKTLFSSEG